MLNGEGLRVVLWLSHCIHNCPGCHNPQTHAADSGIRFDEAALDEVFTELQKDYIAGITFSGGDPLSPINRQPVLALCERIRKEFPSKNIWLYTGFQWEEICGLSGIDHVDVVVDGPFVLAEKDNSLPYRGSANQRIIDVKATFAGNGVIEKKI